MSHKSKMLSPARSEGRDHDVRLYGLRHGMAPSPWDSGGAARDRSARQICFLRQTLIAVQLAAQPHLHLTADAGRVDDEAERKA